MLLLLLLLLQQKIGSVKQQTLAPDGKERKGLTCRVQRIPSLRYARQGLDFLDFLDFWISGFLPYLVWLSVRIVQLQLQLQ